ncbi:NADPH-dependent FMN reductase [Latilactobacillus curvatus]|uniref:NAD(P)H-dependent oxidoreductase n=2 Tax=Latilactobacillus curvatus TaxID=28038 RepID=A0A1B2A695_LATCU|nr:NAD(P)H-dependent oxidoreductase [Latilactobacillus curvatus]MDT3394382.1 NAD(P)H-dependent oxidoreductase [Bacillota bacterium]ANY13484.1 NADPH-dependent FMN reductase [Latilactobacillus curvatus]ASN59759.1 NAD(P)H-dependent oxidoreductase [Latilactobacillus curvatus]EHE86675.1 NADPH-dependent FMN reductase family protein [Latilactobacillus curvatus CRL 705]KRK93334.1 NADPH-dependent FMN reductase family protein [Latilactobacillus curvatus JCM 1096 = DSM 20019]
MTKNIAVLIGSLRKDSFSKSVAKSLMPLFPSDYNLEIVEIGDLPLYNQDYDDLDQVPEAYTTFRNKMKTMDAVLFVTPEYNRSVPAVLKNALDVGSRPYGASIWDNKPAEIVSVSPGAISGFGANHHLRQSLVFLNMPTVQQPEAYIGNVMNLLDDNQEITNPDTLGFFQAIVDAFDTLIKRY